MATPPSIFPIRLASRPLADRQQSHKCKIKPFAPPPDEEASGQATAYNSKARVVFAIRELYRKGASLEEADILKTNPDLLLAANDFFGTWNYARSASGVEMFR